MSDIFNGLVSQAEWLDVGFNVTRQGDPIDRLFGDEKTDNIQARWQSIANEFQIPMMAQFHGFDTEAQQTFSIPVDNHNIEKGLIKVKINQSELMRQYKKNGIIGNTQLKDFVLNDGIRLAEQVFTRTKVAKNELMAILLLIMAFLLITSTSRSILQVTYSDRYRQSLMMRLQRALQSTV